MKKIIEKIQGLFTRHADREDLSTEQSIYSYKVFQLIWSTNKEARNLFEYLCHGNVMPSTDEWIRLYVQVDEGMMGTGKHVSQSEDKTELLVLQHIKKNFDMSSEYPRREMAIGDMVKLGGKVYMYSFAGWKRFR